MRAHGHPSRQRAIAKHLDLVRGADDAALGHQRLINRIDSQRGQPLQVDHDESFPSVLSLLQTAKSALGHAPLERHLAAFIARRRGTARARALALVAASRSLAAARADSAADPRMAALGSRSRLEPA